MRQRWTLAPDVCSAMLKGELQWTDDGLWSLEITPDVDDETGKPYLSLRVLHDGRTIATASTDESLSIAVLPKVSRHQMDTRSLQFSMVVSDLSESSFPVLMVEPL